MAWIALKDHAERRFAKGGLGCDAGRADTSQLRDDGLMVRGSLVMESRLASDGRPLQLLSYACTHPWHRGLSIQSIPGGGIVLVSVQGDDTFHAAVALEGTGAGDSLRITYSWDAPARWARLAIERIGTDEIAIITLDAPKPFGMEDLRAIFLDPSQGLLDRHVQFLALSTAIEPIGPMPTLTAHVPVATPYGWRKASTIKRGDLVHSLRGDILPVLHVVQRVVPARGSFRPVRMRAPYFGLRQDILIAPDQRLVIGGSDVEYMFGREHVLVPARHLVNGISAMHSTGNVTATYFHVILPGHEVILAGGTPLESLFIGRIRRKPEMQRASLLANIDRSTLPEHAHAAYPVLKPFEAITLAEQRAA